MGHFFVSGHHQEPGRLQLVPTEIHRPTTHIR
ncbi:HNH endonuclease [Kroppenstedtia sanguinis]|uniref:HNH endonuclease n=1 Tax=Kroppenstedtia sanguinis TaxID=1380684 RepID=A0ABW4C569_9BACL